MTTYSSFRLLSVLSVVLAACAPATADELDRAATGDDQNQTSTSKANGDKGEKDAKEEIVGAWVLDDQFTAEGLVLNADHTFYRDIGSANVQPPIFQRTEGTYEVTTEDGAKVLTLSVTKPTANVTAFDMTFSPVHTGINGTVAAEIVLRSKEVTGGDLGQPHRIYKQQASWCTRAADCAASLDNGWDPESVPAACTSAPSKCVSCDEFNGKCSLVAPK